MNETIRLDENGERFYVCRCGEIHRGDYAAYDFGHHNCFHDSPLISGGVDGYYLCPDCGKPFHLTQRRASGYGKGLMGTISHDAVIVTGWDAKKVEAARQAVVEVAAAVEGDPWKSNWPGLVSPVLASVVNAYAHFFIAPDGSKEWWDQSDTGNEFRQAAIEAIRKVDPWLTIVTIKYGELGEEIAVVEYEQADTGES